MQYCNIASCNLAPYAWLPPLSLKLLPLPCCYCKILPNITQFSPVYPTSCSLRKAVFFSVSYHDPLSHSPLLTSSSSHPPFHPVSTPSASYHPLSLSYLPLQISCHSYLLIEILCINKVITVFCQLNAPSIYMYFKLGLVDPAFI